EEEEKYGKDGNNGTDGKRALIKPFRLFRYFRLFRTLSRTSPVEPIRIASLLLRLLHLIDNCAHPLDLLAVTRPIAIALRLHGAIKVLFELYCQVRSWDRRLSLRRRLAGLRFGNWRFEAAFRRFAEDARQAGFQCRLHCDALSGRHDYPPQFGNAH